VSPPTARAHWRHRVARDRAGPLGPLLLETTGLPRPDVEDLLDKGAVWVRRARGRGAGKTLRVRDGAFRLGPGDLVDAYRDPAILAVSAPEPEEIEDRARYGAWFKPAGLMSQGTRYGDHASLLRRVEIRKGTAVRLVHRLDREAAGVVVLAYDGRTAGRLSSQFAGEEAVKDYVAVVLGDLAASYGEDGRFDAPLDGRPARTRFRVIATSPGGATTWVALRIDTGRTHQIRRHLDGAGHPVIGDPRYGRGNKNRDGLRLAAVSLELTCPVRDVRVRFTVGPDRIAWLHDAPGGRLAFDEAVP
jgi:tRNA pseudouridine32 synthase/23S rRNA pseudouridine746 synthase